ncbi:MAG: selenide, water dikinase SelD [Rhodobacteraceae bacterium]|nr:selenide, water dikinase SelD [Paracoccaceae bacterium]
MDQHPFTQDLVFIGGGHTHALVLHEWAMKPLPGGRLTVINPEPVAAYSGMLPGYIAGHYRRDELDIDLVRLCRRAGARLVIGKANAIDREEKLVHVPGRPPIAYDVASIDVGITSTLTRLEGFAEHGLPAKPLSLFAKAWKAYRANAEGKAEIVVLGAGVAGAEVVMAMVHALREDGRAHQVTLIDQGPAYAALGPRASAALRAAVADHGVRLIENTKPTAVRADAVVLETGEEIAANLVVGAAGSNPYPWLEATGLTDNAGFIPVDRYLRSRDQDIFAVGDCAAMETPRPKSGVYAVRQAPFLTANLRNALSGSGPKKPYVPQKDYLKLISLGRKTALGEKWGLSTTADRLWKLKDDIDDKFMTKLNQPVPDMSKVPFPRAKGSAPAMICAGCGSKVGQGALKNALGPDGARDDAAVLEGGRVISVDHLRAFVDDPVRMAQIAVTHAMGDVWAMGAQPETALASVILPRQSSELAARELGELMSALRAAVEATGAKLVGGHTTQGSELTLGLTVTGRLQDDPITLAGAQPGDALVLTKPIGSGVLMAAAMQGRARGWDVFHAWEAMAAPQAQAAAILKDAHAMTDVTGFGLYGHLKGICEASGTRAELWLEQVPLLEGALQLSTDGIRSTLYPENAAGDATEDPRRALLYDPQTGGGLLAAVADEAVAEALRAAGVQAAVVGRVTEGSGVSII